MTPDLSAPLEIAICSDPGLLRSHNEDAVYANPARGLAILADGMGGYNAGEVASSMATTLLAEALEKRVVDGALAEIDDETRLPVAHRCLQEQITQANDAIYRAAESQSQFSGMGTTLVVALFHDRRLTVAHIGDSRVYRLRGGQLEQLTRDHSLLQEQIDNGMITPEEARHSQNKNLVTRALGVDPGVDAELHDHEIAAGDIFLLCSDGLNDMVADDEIAATLQAPAADLQLVATRLVQAANDHGGRDNVSVILIRVGQECLAPRNIWARLHDWLKSARR